MSNSLSLSDHIPVLAQGGYFFLAVSGAAAVNSRPQEWGRSASALSSHGLVVGVGDVSPLGLCWRFAATVQ